MSARDPHDDEQVAAAFAEAAGARQPSRFETARAARDLELLLDREERRRGRGWRPAVVVGAVAFAAAVGVFGGFALQSPNSPVPVALARGAAGAEAVPPDVAAGVATHEEHAAVMPPAPAPPAAAVAPVAHVAPLEALAALPAPAMPGPTAPVRRADPGWRATADALSAAGNDLAAARVQAQALRTDDAAGVALMATLRRSPKALDQVDAALAAATRAEPMRVRCELLLLYRRDRGALEACRAFAQQFPEHPGARVLSFAAGRVAEDELGDLAAAEAEYGRAVLLSPLAGLPSTDALLARARVRAARGVVDEARADLRLYLHLEPAARGDPAVRALMMRLGVGEAK